MAFRRQTNTVVTRFRRVHTIYRVFISNMNTEEVIIVRNSLWRRITESVSLENVTALARAVRKAFGRLVVCGRKSNAISLASEEEFNTNKPIYTGPKIQVPWRGEEFKYPADRYLTNKETLKQLNLLELRFRAQSKILKERKQKIENELNADERYKREEMAKTVRESSIKFSELRNLVKEFKKYVAKKRFERSNGLSGEKS